MDRLPIESFVHLGKGVRFLVHARAGIEVHGDGHLLYVIERVIELVEEAGLHVTMDSTPYRELRDFGLGLASYDADATLDRKGAATLSNAATSLEMFVDAESLSVVAYQFDKPRIRPEILLDPAGLLSDGVWDLLPFQVRYDLEEACKCLLFERATACAFHLMRAVEGVVRVYYFAIYRRGRLSNATWGQMTHHLRRRKSKPLPDASVLEELDYVRRNYRNPTQHPDAIYDHATAEDLMHRAVGSINKTILCAVSRGLALPRSGDEAD